MITIRTNIGEDKKCLWGAQRIRNAEGMMIVLIQHVLLLIPLISESQLLNF